ncbi:MAG: class I SAM-dependent methyltransferase [Elusimicrobiota bacterium]|nr:MAG: class I SAM-dependent methyltransferase [Elusimicrobiota bacterium]
MSAEPLDELAAAARAWGVEAPIAPIADYLRFVQAENERVNITADPAWDDLVLKHASDGLFAVSVLRPLLPPAPKILDLGSGAGFIGVVMKLAWPEAEVTLMESVERKYRFLSAAAARTRAKGLRVLYARAGAGAP